MKLKNLLKIEKRFFELEERFPKPENNLNYVPY
jgi:hypothetical protein